MLKSISIENFQSHKKTELVFHPGINVVVGTSDTGKTAIIRALHWLVWNRPRGDAMCSSWGGETQVTLETDTDTILRTKKDNAYYLNGVKLEAVGSDVPEEIVKALNIDDINLQQQFDRPFLLDSSPGAVAQHFNTIAHLDVIDNALRNINQWIRSLESNITSDEQHLVEMGEAIHQFDHLDEFEEAVVKLEELNKQKETLEQDQLSLRGLCCDVESVEKLLATKEAYLKGESQVTETLDLIKTRKTVVARREALTDIVTHLEQNKLGSDRYTRILAVENGVSEALLLLSKRQAMKIERTALGELIHAIEAVEVDGKTVSKQAARLQSEFDAAFPSTVRCVDHKRGAEMLWAIITRCLLCDAKEDFTSDNPKLAPRKMAMRAGWADTAKGWLCPRHKKRHAYVMEHVMRSKW